ncbi:50S ribosome-binding GTPase, partial [Desulfovibrio sp. OttesenSCG-928-M16]|nr:50S ribosome-binding GTPase [Desulfovibrio sp. OttesenSCG-928-M16]
MKQVPKAVLLGRPNVGKSTLFNRLIRSNRAITHDMPGVTRDRMEGTVRRHGCEDYLLVDTGGVTLDSHARPQEGPEGIRGFEAQILEQARQALLESDLLCLVVDGREGLIPLDRHLADFLRKANKQILLVVNKIDGPERQDLLMAEFHSLGLPMLPCSAEHGYNLLALEEALSDALFPPEPEEPVGEDEALLLEGATKRQKKRLLQAMRQDKKDARPEAGPLPAQEGYTGETEDDFIGMDGEVYDTAELAAEANEVTGPDADTGWSDPGPGPGPLRLALLGRPNAGKSSLVNALGGKQRMIVSDVAGTTRDSVDVQMDIDGESVTFVDTAGVRRKAKITDTVERYSVNSSIKSSTKAHVTLLVLDASE